MTKLERWIVAQGMVSMVFFSLCVTSFVLPTSGNSNDPKILVVFYSRSGITKGVAEELAKGLNADIEQIIDLKDRSGITGFVGGGKDATQKKMTAIGETKKNPADYDFIVIGTPVWAGTITPAIRTYIDKNKSSFKKVAVFVTATSTKINKVLPKFESAVGQKAIASEGFVKKDFSPERKNEYGNKLSGFSKRVIEAFNKTTENPVK
jgi:flavodoxin